MRLLLLSNSRNPDSGYLEHARDWFADFLRGVRRMAFVPYAAVRFSYDDYERAVAEALGDLVEIRSVHHGVPAQVVEECDAVAVGGGNTFHLLHEMARFELPGAIRKAVRDGKPYCGWSAGSNVASPTIRTTNDMPIIEPPSFEALELVPFQINPHYLDAHPDRHMGETREERLLEFCRVNPQVPVVGLREGSAILVDGGAPRLLGNRTARIFRGTDEPAELESGSTLEFSGPSQT
ncbi:MAG: dipeptidase PepE [Rhodothermales bacterium]|nr:dipeptidase PepE [Rhodothermales bacterium]